jgi:hypothetical protein
MGVKQGCPLSLLLCGLYLDGLLEDTHFADAPVLNGTGVPVLLYANDYES